MQTKKLIAGAVVAAFLIPAASFAQTLDVQTQAKSLLEQIQALQMQLKVLLASSSAPIKVRPDGMMNPGMMNPGQMGKAVCLELKRDLRVGAQGEDVRKLQEMLASDPESGFRSKATGFFGPLTATAMAKYQSRMGIASSTDGRVGPLTRGFFQRACGQGLGQGGMKDEMMKGASFRGEITASSASSITLTNRESESRTAVITSSTVIKLHSSATSTPSVGTSADLVVGKMAMVEGEKNTDGTITARLIIVGVLPPEPPMKPLPLRGPGMMQ